MSILHLQLLDPKAKGKGKGKGRSSQSPRSNQATVFASKSPPRQNSSENLTFDRRAFSPSPRPVEGQQGQLSKLSSRTFKEKGVIRTDSSVHKVGARTDSGLVNGRPPEPELRRSWSPDPRSLAQGSRPLTGSAQMKPRSPSPGKKNRSKSPEGGLLGWLFGEPDPKKKSKGGPAAGRRSSPGVGGSGKGGPAGYPSTDKGTLTYQELQVIRMKQQQGAKEVVRKFNDTRDQAREVHKKSLTNIHGGSGAKDQKLTSIHSLYSSAGANEPPSSPKSPKRSSPPPKMIFAKSTSLKSTGSAHSLSPSRGSLGVKKKDKNNQNQGSLFDCCATRTKENDEPKPRGRSGRPMEFR